MTIARMTMTLAALLATTAAAPAMKLPAMKLYTGAGGLVRLRYPATMPPGSDFGGATLMHGGWRVVWDATPVGPGTGVVSFAAAARPGDGQGTITESLRIGYSRDARVVATCGTAGMTSGDGCRLPDRRLGGHRWTVWRNGDEGMSQSVEAIDWRTVVDGACYAIDRISYAVHAADAPPAGTPAQAIVAARLDAVLATVEVGGRR